MERHRNPRDLLMTGDAFFPVGPARKTDQAKPDPPRRRIQPKPAKAGFDTQSERNRKHPISRRRGAIRFAIEPSGLAITSPPPPR
jgi:hypothetical protein